MKPGNYWKKPEYIGQKSAGCYKEQSQSNYQLKQMNRMLEQARESAEEAKEDRDRFAMAVSHELRTPLNFIIGFSDLMVHAPETYKDPA